MKGDRHTLIFSGVVAAGSYQTFVGTSRLPFPAVARRMYFVFTPGMLGLVSAGFFVSGDNFVSTSATPPGSPIISAFGNTQMVSGYESIELLTNTPIPQNSYVKLYVNNFGGVSDVDVTGVIEIEEM
ncbi:MAG: hypothetical protein V2G41_09940 [bacterium JZ-2024 1]